MCGFHAEDIFLPSLSCVMVIQADIYEYRQCVDVKAVLILLLPMFICNSIMSQQTA
jgi:hypothetical protein